MNKSGHIPIPIIAAATLVAVVALVGAVRGFKSQEAVSTDLAVPAKTWDATSTRPSFAVDDSIEFSALPTLPVENDWEISALPNLDSHTFRPLPESHTFKPLPKIENEESLGDALFEIRPLPVLGVDQTNPREKQQPAFGINDAGRNNFEFNNFEFRKLNPAADDLVFDDSKLDTAQQVQARHIESAKSDGPKPHGIKPHGIKPDDADLSIARRLRALPTPEMDFQQHASFQENQELTVAAASAELEITAPGESRFSGATIGALPKQLADRIAAIEPKKKKKVVAAPKKGEKKAPPKSSSAKDDFKLAAQPKIGDHYVQDKPQTDDCSHLIEPLLSDFSGDAINPYLPYDPLTQMNVYQGKTLNANQRPLVELGRPWYQLGQLSPGSSVLGFHNNVNPQFLIFGDTRVGYASNNQNGESDSLIATQVNLDFDLKLTGTERFHAFISPTGGAQHNRYLLDEDRYVFEGDANIDFGYFEGDLGALVGGAIGKTLPFDLPFTVGIIPLVVQNGVWLEDAFLGGAFTLPAKNSPRFNISNMDITFFAGYDKLNSDAFAGDDSAARVMGMASFIEALNGYIEVDYAFLDDRTFDDRSYHNIGIGYTRRYGRFLSNSTRVIVNAGQSTDVVENTADGVLLLSENSLITGHPTNIVPYFNMFAGFDRPQSVARAGAAGGVLRNTGILFESDNLTGYPTLDATANDTYGFAAGLNLLGRELDQQLVLETAMLGVMGDAGTRKAQGDQFGVGFRYQLPLSNSVIFRADGMMGFLRNDDDVSGIRVEVRKKF